MLSSPQPFHRLMVCLPRWLLALSQIHHLACFSLPDKLIVRNLFIQIKQFGENLPAFKRPGWLPREWILGGLLEGSLNLCIHLSLHFFPLLNFQACAMDQDGIPLLTQLAHHEGITRIITL
jgi:hypothetical protein